MKVNCDFKFCFYQKLFGASQVSFPTSSPTISIPQALFSSHSASLQPFTLASTEEEDVWLSCKTLFSRVKATPLQVPQTQKFST